MLNIMFLYLNSIFFLFWIFLYPAEILKDYIPRTLPKVDEFQILDEFEVVSIHEVSHGAQRM